jgi:hypothetical protein
MAPHAVVPSESFWWRNIFSLVDAYKAITICELGSGHTILLWSDLWHQQRLENQFPRLLSFPKDKLQSVIDFCNMEDALHGFRGYDGVIQNIKQFLPKLRTSIHDVGMFLWNKFYYLLKHESTFKNQEDWCSVYQICSLLYFLR